VSSGWTAGIGTVQNLNIAFARRSADPAGNNKNEGGGRMPSSSGIERARTALARGLPPPSGAVDAPVALSWRRCLERGLDPAGEPMANVIPFPEVRRRRDGSALLRRLALAEMQLLYSQISGSDFMIAFADADGVVLDTVSDRRFAESAAGRAIVPGSVWREEERGTNALGLAVLERAPVAIYGREHFFACHGHLTCIAVPVFDPSGDLAGLIDASCSNEARQQHTHALLRMAAAEMENALIYQAHADALILAFHPRPEYLDTLSAGLVAVTPDGEVRSVNRPGEALLAGLDVRIGASIEDLFDVRFAAAVDTLIGDGILRARDRAGSALYLVCRRLGGLAPRTPRPAAAAKLPAPPPAPLGFVCEDPALQQRMHGLAAAVASRTAIAIRGETGTGKELMARHVHALSGRAGAFVAVNCGAVPEPLFIAELFGHERGAYTNARSDGAPGLVAAADRGTLFLDEVADIPIAAQTALLRFLDTMEVRPVGGQRTRQVDVQVVSATNVDLEAAIAERRFRADLYYRLTGFAVELPPLAARADFAAIVRHALAAVSPGTAITEGAVARLAARSWPGNIRELQAVLRRAAAQARDASMDARGTSSTGAACLDETMFAAADADPDVCPDCAGHPLDAARCRRIHAAVAAAGGNISVASRSLGISRTTIYKHLGSMPPQGP
jgi:transcriptional regulator of acetoin/glycerol metabolism